MGVTLLQHDGDFFDPAADDGWLQVRAGLYRDSGHGLRGLETTGGQAHHQGGRSHSQGLREIHCYPPIGPGSGLLVGRLMGALLCAVRRR